MSYWTYISGVITIHVFGVTQPHKRYILDTVLQHLPVVSGSERNMKVHVIQAYGYNGSSTVNEFGEPVRFHRNADNDEWTRTQDNYFLVVEANLRDRMFDETKLEFNKWLCRMAKRLWIKDILVRLEGQGRELLITDSSPYEEMLEYGEKELPWTDYLYWEKAEDSDYPAVLCRKYQN